MPAKINVLALAKINSESKK